MKRLYRLTLLALWTAAPVFRAQDNKAVIEGSILRAGSGTPLDRAEVTLIKVQQADETPVPPERFQPFVTRGDGRFQFRNLEPGAYRIDVMRSGFVGQQYRESLAVPAGQVLTLTAGQTVRDITFRLQAAATVSGRVIDLSGEPVADRLVSLSRLVYQLDGTRILEKVGAAFTDDRGQYRVFWVPAGRYYLAASYDSGTVPLVFGRANMEQVRRYPTTYYPGTLELSRASIIEVQPGTELNGLDVVLTQPPAYKLSGRLVDASSAGPPGEARVTLLPRSERGGPVVISGEAFPKAVYRRDGTFEFSNVAPGFYWLRAEISEAWDQTVNFGEVTALRRSDLFQIALLSRSRTAQVPVDVVGADLSSIVLTVAPGITIPLRVRLEDQDLTSIKTLDEFRLSLMSRQSPEALFSMQTLPLDAGGNGKIGNVSPGEYRVIAHLESEPGLYVKEARYERIDALDGFWRIDRQETGRLEVVLSSKSAGIEGALLDASSKPVLGVDVVLIPDRSRHRSELYRTSRTDENGNFRFRGIPPGDYKAFAWEALEPLSYFDPEVLVKYELRGQPVRLAESSKAKVDVRIIPAN